MIEIASVYWVLLLALIVTALIKGAVTVDQGFVGAVFRFGKLCRIQSTGLNFLIPFVERVEMFPIATFQDEFPDEPEYVDQEHGTPAEGMVSPFRIMHSGKDEALFLVKKAPFEPGQYRDQILTQYNNTRFDSFSDEEMAAMAQDSLHAPLTSEISVAVEWGIGYSFEEMTNFVTHVNPNAGRTREQEVFKRMSDKVRFLLQDLLGEYTLGHVKDKIDVFSQALQEDLEILVGQRPDPTTGRLSDKPWGIYIVKAFLMEPSGGKRVNVARADAAAAISRSQDRIRQAEADAQSTIKAADAKAHDTRVSADAKAHETRVSAAAKKDEEILKGEGEAGRIAAMAEVMRDENARFIAMLDVAEQVLPKANATYIPIEGIVQSVLSLGQGMVNGKKVIIP